MASDIESLEIKGEGDSISPGRQPEIPPPQNILDSELITDPYSLMRDISHRLYGLWVILRFLFKACLWFVGYAVFGIFSVFILPLLFAAFVVLRLFQFIGSSKNLPKQLLIKRVLCLIITVFVLVILIEIGLFYPIVKYVPRVKRIMIIGLPITKWINIICILIGIFFLNIVILFSPTFIIARLVWGKAEIKLSLISESISEIIGCLLFWWAEFVVMGSVPTFKQSKVFGIYTHNWITVSLFLVIGYNIITLLTRTLVWLLVRSFRHRPIASVFDIYILCWCDGESFSKKYVGYIATGLKRCVISILSMVMLLITWVVYFGNRLNTTPQNKRILEIGTWTLVSLLICSFLWLIKSCILLYWKAHSIYDRLHYKIIGVGKLFYFLIMLSHNQYNSETFEFNERNSDDSSRGSYCYRTPNRKAYWVLSVGNDESENIMILNRESVREELINNPRSSVYDLQRTVKGLLNAPYALSKESTIGDLDHLRGDDSGVDNANCVEVLMKVMQVEGNPHFDADWKMLLKLLPDVHTAEDVTFDKVKTFMERAHSRCIFLVDTLISEYEVVKCLSQVISWLIIAVTFIMWLLLTGLASTKVLVLIASPALAATFIFGDTTKSLFQGLIFVYVVRPFDVGDLCLIDKKLLEVKRIGIWSTTFSKVRSLGKKHQIIYPNSVLALKNVINHKTNFDWDDYLEFLSSPDVKITEPLKHKIETYLDDEKDKFTPNFHSVEILEMGDKAKIVVHVKYKFKTTEGWTNFECLKAKEKRRFELSMYVQKLVKRVESEANTSEMEDFLTRG